MATALKPPAFEDEFFIRATADRFGCSVAIGNLWDASPADAQAHLPLAQAFGLVSKMQTVCRYFRGTSNVIPTRVKHCQAALQNVVSELSPSVHDYRALLLRYYGILPEMVEIMTIERKSLCGGFKILPKEMPNVTVHMIASCDATSMAITADNIEEQLRRIDSGGYATCCAFFLENKYTKFLKPDRERVERASGGYTLWGTPPRWLQYPKWNHKFKSLFASIRQLGLTNLRDACVWCACETIECANSLRSYFLESCVSLDVKRVVLLRCVVGNPAFGKELLKGPFYVNQSRRLTVANLVALMCDNGQALCSLDFLCRYLKFHWISFDFYTCDSYKRNNSSGELSYESDYRSNVEVAIRLANSLLKECIRHGLIKGSSSFQAYAIFDFVDLLELYHGEERRCRRFKRFSDGSRMELPTDSEYDDSDDGQSSFTIEGGFYKFELDVQYDTLEESLEILQSIQTGDCAGCDAIRIGFDEACERVREMIDKFPAQSASSEPGYESLSNDD